MPRSCDFCGRTISIGNQIERRGKAKYLGGVGRKITGITMRKFQPNLQYFRAYVDGGVRRVRVCSGCIRMGKVVRPPARPKKEKATA